MHYWIVLFFATIQSEKHLAMADIWRYPQSETPPYIFEPVSELI